MQFNYRSARRILLLLVVMALLGIGLYAVLTGNRGGVSLPEPTKDAVSPDPSGRSKSLVRELDTPSLRNPDLTTQSVDSGNPEIQMVLEQPPHIAYQKLHGPAEAGDARAQLMLTEVLERCRHSSVQSAAELTRLEGRGEMPAEMLSYYRETLERCAGLYEMLGEYDLDTLWAFWMEEAAATLAVARVALALNSLEAEYSDALYQQLQAGITDASDDWIQQRVARQSAFAFFRSFVEPVQYDGAMHDSGYYLRSEDSLAWDYLMCENSVHCDLKAMEKQVSDHYYEYQISDMRKRAGELDQAIKTGNWERLGLQLGTD